MQISNLQKKFGPFSALFGKSDKNSAAKFSGRKHIYSAPSELCGRNFGPLVTLVFCSNFIFLDLHGCELFLKVPPGHDYTITIMI
jgi:hypothetical protein